MMWLRRLLTVQGGPVDYGHPKRKPHRGAGIPGQGPIRLSPSSGHLGPSFTNLIRVPSRHTQNTDRSETDIELTGSQCTMPPEPKCKKDRMPNHIDRYRITFEYKIGCFTRIACPTLSTPHAHATSCDRLTG